jgi:hypothetical protein
MSDLALAHPVPNRLRLASAFLALSDDGGGEAPECARRSPARALAALAAVAVLAVAAPLARIAPSLPAPPKIADQPAATLGSKAGVAVEDDEDGGGAP